MYINPPPAPSAEGSRDATLSRHATPFREVTFLLLGQEPGMTANYAVNFISLCAFALCAFAQFAFKHFLEKNFQL
jgi:hypothetical protein